MTKHAVLFLLSFFLAATPALAASSSDPESLGKSGAWHALQYEEEGAPVCYMIAKAEKSTGKVKGRSTAHLLVTHRPAEQSFDVVSFVAGYAFKPGSSVTVEAGKDKIKLFTDGDTAWAADNATDKKLGGLIRSGSKLVLRAESKQGVKTVDTFSLSGSGKAYQRINSACGR